MDTIQVSATGGVVFWECGPTRRELLHAQLEALGFQEFTPPARTDEACLQASLKDHCDVENRVVRRLGRDKIVQKRKSRKDGFEVVDVKRAKQDGSNVYTMDFAMTMNGEGPKVLDGWPSHEQRDRIANWFTEHKATLTGSQIGGALVKIMAHLGGVALRKAGGFYWVPPEAMKAWEQVADAVEACDQGEKTEVHVVHTEMTARTARAVRRAITDEVEAAADDILEEIVGGLGQEAMDRRKDVAKALHQKVEEYERHLSEDLEALHGTVAKVEELITQMALQSMGV